ncbi:MAG: XRE family transcriptional regulator [Eggerthellaceae bacterium]|jgi:repressor LexA|nr:XRE family transcriptional regulator [Eggerthellaceae bacterium]MDR2721893.1 XRE family transcriptional regulator [Coriobacteriaceae bacterium]
MEARRFIAKKIREYRTSKLHITANTLGAMLKPVRSGKAISSWEVGRTQPDADYMIQLAQIFDEPIAHFYPEKYSKTAQSTPEVYTDVALFGSIAAGKPLAIIPIENTLPIPREVHQRYPEAFLLKVDGESMNNVLPNGAYALIDPSQNEPVDNGAYAFCLNQEDATIKRIKKLTNGYELLPDSKDSTFKPLVFDYSDEDSQEIAIIGRAVWMLLPFDWEI